MILKLQEATRNAQNPPPNPNEPRNKKRRSSNEYKNLKPQDHRTDQPGDNNSTTDEPKRPGEIFLPYTQDPFPLLISKIKDFNFFIYLFKNQYQPHFSPDITTIS